MGQDLFNEASGANQEDLWDQFDSTQMSVAMSMAMRLQADTITEGGQLHVDLPNSDQTIALDVVAIGKIDPDILSPDRMVDPATQDTPPLPGIAVDLGPLFGGEEGHRMTLALNPN